MSKRKTLERKVASIFAGGALDMRNQNEDASLSIESMAILDWYDGMLNAVTNLSEQELKDFIEWDGCRSPGTLTSAWPGFIVKIGMKPGTSTAGFSRRFPVPPLREKV